MRNPQITQFIESMTVAHPRIPTCIRCRETNPDKSHRCDLIEDDLLMHDEQDDSSQTTSYHLRGEEERNENKSLLDAVAMVLLGDMRRLYKRITGTHRVAIVIPMSNYNIDQMVWGAVKSLKHFENVKFTPHVYNMNCDSMFLHKTILPLLQRRKYDLIYTIGSECTSVVVNFFNRQATQVPILFSGVANPRELGLDTYAKDYVSGIRSNDQLSLQVASLLAVKPSTKKVGLILPYKCGLATASFKKELHKLLREYGVDVVLATVNIPQEVRDAAAYLISQGVDTIIAPPDRIVSGMIEVLTEICNAARVTLYGSGLSTREQGAALAFGSFSYSTGESIAQMAGLILRDGVSPERIPISFSKEKFYLVVNPNTRHKQGLFIELDRLILIEHTVSE